MASSVPYDPYIPSSSAHQTEGGNSKAANIQSQIDGTVDVMRDNINRMAQRGDQLDALQDKTDHLAEAAQGFRKGANRVRKQMFLKDMKMRMCLIVGVLVLIIVIVVPIAVHFSK